MRNSFLALLASLPFFFGANAAHAQDKAQLTGMQNLDFGLISNIQVDSSRSLNLCVFSSTAQYRVTAYGSGAGGAFALGGAAGQIPYVVEWSPSAGSNSGTQLSPNSSLSAQSSSAVHKTCNRSPFYSASLIVRLRASDLASARAGDYSGSLTVIIAAE